jgi:hypothetical protein
MEERNATPTSLADNLLKIQKVFEAAGLEFIPADGSGAGVRLRKDVVS